MRTNIVNLKQQLRKFGRDNKINHVRDKNWYEIKISKTSTSILFRRTGVCFKVNASSRDTSINKMINELKNNTYIEIVERIRASR